MPKLKKLNRVIDVEKEHVESYRKRGYDVIDEDGNVTKSATDGKNITAATYNKAVEKNGEYELRITELEKENNELKDEVKVLETENEKLDKDLRKIQAANNEKSKQR